MIIIMIITMMIDNNNHNNNNNDNNNNSNNLWTMLVRLNEQFALNIHIKLMHRLLHIKHCRPYHSFQNLHVVHCLLH